MTQQPKHDLTEILRGLGPRLDTQRYVFVSLPHDQGSTFDLSPLATFQEVEGTSLVISEADAKAARLEFQTAFRKITLSVHSDLQSVGLTAAVSTALAQRGISCNIIAAYHHDHLLVPAVDADTALSVLQDLMANSEVQPDAS